MTIMNSFISFLSPRKMKYFFKLRNVIREKGETNNFTYLLETMTENVIYIYFFAKPFD